MLKLIDKTNLNYSVPEVELYKVVAECGYATSSILPGFGTEEDDFIY